MAAVKAGEVGGVRGGEGDAKDDFQTPETYIFQPPLFLSCKFSGTSSCRQPVLLTGSRFPSFRLV